MVVQADTRYTKLRDGNWIIESTTLLPISTLQAGMKFVDDAGNTHEITRVTTPDGNPEAPYYYFAKVSVKE